MENIIIAPQERKDLILEMKREVKPSRRLRMHIALLAADGCSPTEISRTLFCSRTTVYTVASRFLREGRSSFDDIRRRGPRPLLGEEANERFEKLLEALVRPSIMGGCARAGAASLSPCNFSGSGPPRLAGRASAARCTAWASAGGGRAPSHPKKTPRSKSNRSGRGFRMSCK